MISIVVTYRIRAPEYRDLWDITTRSVQGLIKTADYDFELIAIDNGSHSDEYAQELNLRSGAWYGVDHMHGFRQLRFDEPVSLSIAWNTGIHQADGDYIMLANNDIIYHEKGWMSRMIEPFNRETIKAGIVGIQHMSWGQFGGFVEGSLFVFPVEFRDKFAIDGPTDERPYNMVMDEQFTYAADVDFNHRVKLAGYRELQVDGPPLQPRWMMHLGHRTLNTLANSEEIVVQITHEDRIKLCHKWGFPEQIVD